MQAIAIPPKTGQPQGLLVALHGWGANAEDLAGLAPYLNLPNYQFLFPDAPFPHPYAPGGKMWYSLPMYYDFRSLPEFQNQADLIESKRQLTDWLYSLHAMTGIPLSRTVLAGFSQGGAMTLDVGLQLPLAALMVLSGYLHAPIPHPNSPPPVLMVHGRLDTVVPIAAAQQARDNLTAAGVAVEYQESNMGHEIQPIILEVMQSFVRKGAFYLGETTRESIA